MGKAQQGSVGVVVVMCVRRTDVGKVQQAGPRVAVEWIRPSLSTAARRSSSLIHHLGWTSSALPSCSSQFFPLDFIGSLTI